MLPLDYQQPQKSAVASNCSRRRLGIPILLILVISFFHSVASFFLIWSGWSTDPIGPMLELAFHFPLLSTFGYMYSLTDPAFFALLLANSLLNSAIIVGVVYGAMRLFNRLVTARRSSTDDV